MVPAAVLIATAATWWAGVAPGAVNHCPNGVAYNVKPAAGMVNQGAGVMAEAPEGGCVITFRAGVLASISPRSACALVIHEYGHAAMGLPHYATGIMGPSSSDWGIPGICYQYPAYQRASSSRVRTKRLSPGQRTRQAATRARQQRH